MSVNIFEEKKGTTPDPSQSNNNQGAGQSEQESQEGSFSNVETGVNSKEYFDDDFESQEEDEITREEPRTEKDGRTGKS